MKKTALNILTIMATTALMIGVAPSQANTFNWTGPGPDWADSDNWEDGPAGEYPGSGTTDDNANIGIDDAAVTVSSPISLGTGDIRLGSGSASSPAVLNIQSDLQTRNFFVGTSSYRHGIVNHTAGTLQLDTSFQNGFIIGEDSDATVAYNFGSSTDLGANNPSVTYNTRLRLEFGDLSVSMSGYGSWSGVRFDAWMETGNSLDLRVQGGNLDISLDGGDWGTVFAPGVTYTAVIDSTGISTWNSSGIQFRDRGTGESATFALELDGYDFNEGERFVIYSAGSLADTDDLGELNRFRNIAHGDVITVDGNVFEASYGQGLVGGGSDYQFVLTAIPEPATAGMLLGVAGLALVVLRRRIR